MQQMQFERPGVVRWIETNEPKLEGRAASEGALVRPIAVATCDLDISVLRGEYPLAGPYPFGHEGVGEIIEVGEDVQGFAVGDRVIVPFQISCGRCAACRRGRTGNCQSHPALSTFGLGRMGGLGWGGLLCDVALVPHADAMLVPLPADVEPAAVASASDNIPDAWRCVGPQLTADPGAEVLVIGSDHGPNSIGLYAVGLALAAGASRVVYLDEDPTRAAIAEAYGAEIITTPPPRKVGSFGVTVDAGGSEAALRCALNSTAFDGTCTSPSVYREDPSIPMFQMYSRCCSLHTGRAHVRPAIPAVLDLVARGFDPSRVTSQVVDWSDAEQALADPPMKLVLTRD